MPKHITIAVAGDVHGHLVLLYRLLRRWEREHQEQVDLVLQVGDMGAFPPPFRLDRATQNFAKKDPDELGFRAFYEGDPEADEIFGPDAPDERRIQAETWFIKGNHEDFVFLDEVSSGATEPVPVDAYGKISYLRSGVTGVLEKHGLRVRVGGLGGISRDRGPDHDQQTAHYTRNDLQKLRRQGAVDIFLSHEPPYGAASDLHPRYMSAGSQELRAHLDEHPPRFHFCGHYHEDGQRLLSHHRTESYLLNAVNFWKPHQLNVGCLGILRWGEAGASFHILNEPWMREYTAQSYRHL